MGTFNTIRTRSRMICEQRGGWLGSNVFYAAAAMGWLAALGAAPSTVPPNGLRENTPRVHVLKDAKIVTAPGQVIERGTLVIRDGVVAAVGAEVELPTDARVWDMKGKVIYPGLIDAYSEQSSDGLNGERATKHWNPFVTAEVSAGEMYRPDAAQNTAYRGQGFVLRLVAPAANIIKGTSALVTTADKPADRVVVRPQVALHVKLSPERGASREIYPNSPMGAVALVRQTFSDAQWYQTAWQRFEKNPVVARPEQNAALAAMKDFAQGSLPVIVDAPDEWYFLRADRLGAEFGLHVICRGSGAEYRRLAAVAGTGRAVIVPVDFPKAPDVKNPAAALNVPLEKLMHWDLAVENPGRLANAGVRIALTSHGLKERASFLGAVRQAVARGLSTEQALSALTTTPAELLGTQAQYGTLEVGKSASLVVADGELFEEKTQLLETWVDGQRYENRKTPLVELPGTWEFEVLGANDEKVTLIVEVPTDDKGKVKIKRGDKEATASSSTLEGSQWTLVVPGKALDWPGIVRISVGLARTKADDWTGLGQVVWEQGEVRAAQAKQTVQRPRTEEKHADEKASKEKPPTEVKPEASQDKPSDDTSPEVKKDPLQRTEPSTPEEAKAKQAAGTEEKSAAVESKRALFDVVYPLSAFGRLAPPAQPEAVVFRNATVWTCGPRGKLENATVLVRQGKIAAVGSDLEAPAGAIEIDLKGMHLTPGIVDCHSHIATDGGVNESGQAITAEVRIGDFIDADDVQIYRHLAGGVTTCNVLHGSANPIGGQNQVIKLRWGSLPEEMKFAGAPPGIKFALGENVKQSNWGERFTTRYPQTRMGVEQLMRDEFHAAREYRRAMANYREDDQELAPRVDFELEAVAEILEHRRLVHCHSYRQDEILALLRVCEEFGIRIATLQHILEGYKVADAIARHGAGGSSFSDWWGFKVEVADAIPYNGALMRSVGVLMSFNSDDAELARRLNLEAAKAVKYGGVAPEEALKFVTINPAQQLRIDAQVGSIEVGKDADLAIWSGSPLSIYSRCEQTWLDGRQYFDRQADEARRAETDKMRTALVQCVLSSGAPTEGPDEAQISLRMLWPRHDEFCGHGDHGDHEHHHHAHEGEE
jgi:N-acetylglucosamine-6-phosphate deacetylase